MKTKREKIQEIINKNLAKKNEAHKVSDSKGYTKISSLIS